MKNCKYCSSDTKLVDTKLVYNNFRGEKSFICENCRTLFIICNNVLKYQYNSIILNNIYYEIRFDLVNNKTLILKDPTLTRVSSLDYILTDISPSSLKDKLETILTLS